jgi:CDP-diacylglycerol--serine O-phosphatidyltransferase
VSGKDFNLQRRMPFAVLLLIPLGFVVVGLSPPEMLFGMFALFALSGPLLWAWRRVTRGRRTARAASRTPKE